MQVPTCVLQVVGPAASQREGIGLAQGMGPLELGAIGLGDIVGPGPNADPNDQTWSGGGNAINNLGHGAIIFSFPAS